MNFFPSSAPVFFESVGEFDFPGSVLYEGGGASFTAGVAFEITSAGISRRFTDLITASSRGSAGCQAFCRSYVALVKTWITSISCWDESRVRWRSMDF